MGESEASFDDCTPPELAAIAKDNVSRLLPTKSTDRYLQDYKSFMDWRNQHKTTSFSQNVIMAYMVYLKKFKKYKPTTL